ncbi:MAG TPA: SprT family zinc-dependent metalloprotease [Bacteroidales bacterium]|nr:SprT family zinc-dependent metalloprotease [Bacteroidales bacterium]
MEQIQLGDITIDVEQKDIKNLHLSVYPPTGRVRIAAPLHMDLETIRVYAISKLSWIKKQQNRIGSQEREAPRDFVSRESHYYLGKRYLLKILEQDAPPKVIQTHSTLEFHLRPGTDLSKRQEILENWYRVRLKEIVPSYISNWETVLKVRVNEFAIKKMKTKWGSCNTQAKRIWLNLELAKKPPQCLEYIIVHEMLHLLEHRHNARFISLMDNYLPNWRHLKTELNRMPVGHAEWKY